MILAEIMHQERLILIVTHDGLCERENPKESYISMLIQENTRAGSLPSLKGR